MPYQMLSPLNLDLALSKVTLAAAKGRVKPIQLSSEDKMAGELLIAELEKTLGTTENFPPFQEMENGQAKIVMLEKYLSPLVSLRKTKFQKAKPECIKVLITLLRAFNAEEKLTPEKATPLLENLQNLNKSTF